MKARVAVLTRTHDFHAVAIQDLLLDRDVSCHVITSDTLAVRGGMSWSPTGELGSATICDAEDQTVALCDLSLVWWRRLSGEPELPASLDEAEKDLVRRDCRSAMLGMFRTEFQGCWVSDPDATRQAENKLCQLAAARRCGFRIPRTLVSQDPVLVRRFCEALDYAVIVKPVAGTPKTPILTGRVTPEMIASDVAVSLCPAIYQEAIAGDTHLRLCCFGDDILAARLRTDRLDWRYPLDAECDIYQVDRALAQKVRSVVKDLRLRMGIFDLKLDPTDEPVWLEINPQGQFLFLEGLCGLPLREAFANFLISELDQ